ncbi:LOW QUALITY PROTEIN: hypothetical protein FVEG_08074 [Fusarium verticillioides 7600]|uniref:Uncharacterized protein n=1 Tax=Gibberella moniliformis (strain M3125 / FGSC 7600) TaxID=334819 RepID=W7MB37_GIBM7|nr:LOW QUALITY PROTEIN: hypothetical protein FVEG_08074 [Fusarium verticillioides 7600]EWG48221.1 LOW QUALITY PROTEIN: hypothetical protein FVEG_08074 [Fusarium verticillioides 7600]
MALRGQEDATLKRQEPVQPSSMVVTVASESIPAYDGVISQSLRINGMDKRQFRPARRVTGKATAQGWKQTKLSKTGRVPTLKRTVPILENLGARK